jgi:hypothetical protein
MHHPPAPSFAQTGFGEEPKSGPLPEDNNMTRLQVAMSRELGGWPLYTIIIALGQVGFARISIASSIMLIYAPSDAQRYQFPDHPTLRTELGD